MLGVVLMKAATGRIAALAITGAGCQTAVAAPLKDVPVSQVGMLLLSCVLLLAAHGLNQLRRRAQRRHRATLLPQHRLQVEPLLSERFT